MIELAIMARPTKGKNKMEERITFYLSQDLYKALHEARFDLRIERSDLIREALIDYLNKKLPKELRGKSPYKQALKEDD